MACSINPNRPLIFALCMCTAIIAAEGFKPFLNSVGTPAVGFWFPQTAPSGGLRVRNAPIRGMVYNTFNDEVRYMVLLYKNRAIIQPPSAMTAWTKAVSGKWSMKCRRNEIAIGSECRDNCKFKRLICGKPASGFRLVIANTKTVPLVPTSNVATCPDGYFVNAIDCKGLKCDRFGLLCSLMEYVPKSKTWQALSRQGLFSSLGGTFGTGNFSTFTESLDGPIYSFTCFGKRYCTSKIVQHVHHGIHRILGGIAPVSRLMTETTMSAKCPPQTVVSRLQCAGKFCSKIRLGCSKMISGYRVNEAVKTWSSPVVPDEGVTFCPDGYYMQSIHCLTAFCAQVMMGCVLVQFQQ